MRRFARSYLTVSAVIILLANLVLAVFYVRQFSLHAELLSECQAATDCSADNGLADFFVVNGILVGLLLIIWFAVITLASHSHRSDRS